MRLTHWGRGVFSLITAVAILVGLIPSAFAQKANPADLSAIKHFVFIIKENRTFDHYFGTYPGADGVTSATVSTGQIIPLSHMPDVLPRDAGHGGLYVFNAINNGRMDRFDLIPGCNVNNDYLCFTQAVRQDIPNYFAYADNYVLADHMFSSFAGPSFPNHLYAVAAQSGGSLNNPTAAGSNYSWGCDGPRDTTVLVLDDDGYLTNQFPCFDFQTITDSLDQAAVSWKYYAPGEGQSGYNWSALRAINHIRNTPIWTENVVPDTQFVTDALNGQLPEVSWLSTSSQLSEHPPMSSCQGENWTVTQLNAIMQGPDWDSTAVFITWDDFGGFYDHVVPPSSPDQFAYGPRVPLLIVSPFAKLGYISHSLYEYSSFVKIVEERYGLAPLVARDSAVSDMLDSFDFTQSQPPLVLPTRSCSPASTTDLVFPSQAVGAASTSKTVTVNNYATATPLTINSVVLSGQDFALQNNCPPRLRANRSCVIQVLFKPVAAGPRTGTLTITDTDISSPQIVNLTGTGAEITLKPSLLNFGSQRLGAQQNKSVTAKLTNLSNQPLSIISVVAAGDYTQTNTCGGSVSAGGKCTITATFVPTVPGLRYGTIAVTDSDAGSPHVLNLTGIGSSIVIKPSGLSFGNQTVGVPSAPQTFSMTNTGPAAITISSVQFMGSVEQVLADYSQTNNCNGTINSHTTCVFSVVFTPVGTGARNGSALIFNSEEATSPKIVAVSGAGLANPLPSVSQPLTPTSATPGGDAFSLTVRGTSFLSSAVVEWNGTPLVTTYINSQRVLADVPASYIATAGTAKITVVNPAPGGGPSNVVFFPIAGSSSVAFNLTQLAAGTHPSGVATADFDADGILDLAITNKDDATLTVLLGNGDATFGRQSTLSAGHSPAAVVVADFNADGKLDLAVANSADNNISVLLGVGDGTFSPLITTAPTAQTPVALAAADINNDGRPDLAVVNNVENCVSILIGKGDGTFYPLTTPITGVQPVSIALGDTNGDGNLDLVVANHGDNTISVIVGQGDGLFFPPYSFAAGSTPASLLLADVNGDGKLDALTANQGDTTVSLLMGNGDATFQDHQDLAASGAPVGLAVGDFDGDHNLDLAVANAGVDMISLLLGQGDGTFQPHQDFPTGSSPGGLTVGDFNLNGRLDLAVVDSGSNSVSIHLQ